MNNSLNQLDNLEINKFENNLQNNQQDNKSQINQCENNLKIIKRNHLQINHLENNLKKNQQDDSFETNYDFNQFDISKLGITNEPINKLANRVHCFINRLNKYEQNYENNQLKTKNEDDCIKFCHELIKENVKSLDQLNLSLNENSELNNQLNSYIGENSNLRDELCDVIYRLNLEKECNNNLRSKFEEDELQNQEEHNKKDSIINDLKSKLKKCENECKSILDDNQFQMIQYQNDLMKNEKEKLQLINKNKQLLNDKELDELKLLNQKNSLSNLLTEICILFNLASEYRNKRNLFGQQFIETFDFVFGKVKLNLSNITFLDDDDLINMNNNENRSNLNLKDITYNELNYFNTILKEKLIQNEKLTQLDETFINNSKLLSKSLGLNTFQNRLLGNETFKSATITCLNETMDTQQSSYEQQLNSQIDDQTNIQIKQQEQLILKDCLNVIEDDNKVKYLVGKNLMEIDDVNKKQSKNCSFDQIKFMYKSEKTLLDESFQEECHNRFEESFTKNYAKNCLNNGDFKPESLNNILNLNKSKDKSLNNSIIESIIKECDDETDFDENKIEQQYNQDNNNLTKVIRKISNAKQPDDSLILNDSSFTKYHNDDLISFNNNSEIKSIAKSNKHINLQSINGDQTKIFNKTMSDSSSCETELTEDQTDLLVTLNRNFNSRSDGESIEDEYSQSTDSLENASTVTQNEFIKDLSKSSNNSDSNKTTLNNLTNVFFEISENQEFNSTVKIDERCLENNSNNSSDMKLSDDENLDCEQLNFNDDNSIMDPDFDDDSIDDNSIDDAEFAEKMLSKTEISFNLDANTEKDSSDYDCTNMELTHSSTKSRLSSTKLFSSSSSRSTISKQDSYSSKSLLSRLNEETIDDNGRFKINNCSLHIKSKSRCRRIYKRRKPSWRTVCLVYFDPLFSFLYFFFSLFMNTFLILIMLSSLFSTFFAATVLYHHSAIRIYYTSWEEIGYTIINRIIENLYKINHYYNY